MNNRIFEIGHLGINRFFSLDSACYRDGSLDGRTKELLGLVASLVLDTMGEFPPRDDAA